MAYFAKVEQDGIVSKVRTVDDEVAGLAYIQQDEPGNWVQTSYNTRGGIHYGQDGLPDNGTPLRKNYAGVSYLYDGIGFSPPQPYPSWVKNMDTYRWEPPIPYPSEGGSYQWSETSWLNDQIGWVTL